MLTRKQLDLLEFIDKRLQRDGVPPSFDEMKDALDLRSKSGIHRLITALEERGFIRRLPHRARALEIVRLPDALLRDGFDVPFETIAVPMVYWVSHLPTLVMEGGVLQQFASEKELKGRPANLFVASFIGDHAAAYAEEVKTRAFPGAEQTYAPKT